MPGPRGTLLIGTSSWADPGFVAEWYPPGLPADERLPWYALHFDAVEVNAGFYAVPTPDVTARWAEATPPTFTFDVKLHQVLSRHAGRHDGLPVDLRDRVGTTARGRVVLSAALEAALLDHTRAALEPLDEAGKLGVLLLQLSPTFKPGQARLEDLDGLVERLRPWPVAVELRHRAWLHDERRAATLAWFGSRGAAFVGVDAPQGPAPTMLPPVDAATRRDVAYLRLHGRNVEGWMRSRLVAERFAWRYSDEELEEIRGRAEALAEEVAVVHVMANNNRGDLAPQAALRLRELAGQPLRVRTASSRTERVDREVAP